MKSDNESLSNDISVLTLRKLHGLNAKSAKKLVKAVDEHSKNIVKKFAKLQKNEEKDAIEATKKIVAKAKKVSKVNEKATEKAKMNAKIAIVTNNKTTSSPKPVATSKPTPAKKTGVKTKLVPEPITPKIEPDIDSE